MLLLMSVTTVTANCMNSTFITTIITTTSAASTVVLVNKLFKVYTLRQRTA